MKNGLLCLAPSQIIDGMGEKPVMIDPAKYCNDCQQVHEFEACPKCGSDIVISYGLMFGGLGLSKFCENEKCDWFYKELDDQYDQSGKEQKA